MNPLRSRISRLVILMTLVFSAFGVGTASAQEVPTEIDFTIASFTCTSDPGQVSMAAGNIPDSCTPDVGAAASVALPDGTIVGTCTTDASGICKVQAPNEATVVVTLDVASLAGSGTPRENPITTQVITEFAGALFINLPAVPSPAEVPTSLPNTGVGPTGDQSPVWFYGAMILSVACGVLALGVRRQYAHVGR